MGRQRRPSISQGKSPQKTSALDLRFLASRILRNKCLVFKLPSLWYFAMAALENYYYYIPFDTLAFVLEDTNIVSTSYTRFGSTNDMAQND